MVRTRPPHTWVTAGSWKDGAAEFHTGDPVRDESLRRLYGTAQLLRSVREQATVSVHTVARGAGLRRQTLNDLENGHSWPDVMTVHRVALVLGLDSELHPDPRGHVGPRT